MSTIYFYGPSIPWRTAKKPEGIGFSRFFSTLASLNQLNPIWSWRIRKDGRELLPEDGGWSAKGRPVDFWGFRASMGKSNRTTRTRWGQKGLIDNWDNWDNMDRIIAGYCTMIALRKASAAKGSSAAGVFAPAESFKTSSHCCERGRLKYLTAWHLSLEHVWTCPSVDPGNQAPTRNTCKLFNFAGP